MAQLLGLNAQIVGAEWIHKTGQIHIYFLDDQLPENIEGCEALCVRPNKLKKGYDRY